MRFIVLLLFIGSAFAQSKDAPAPKPRLATLVQQKMCDEQAKKKFHEDNPRPNELTNYTSHYDAKANVCYVMVHYVATENGKASILNSVYDAFEGRVYASYTWINIEGKKFWEVAPMECWIKPLGGEKQTCKDSDEFEEMVDKNFGIGR